MEIGRWILSIIFDGLLVVTLLILCMGVKEAKNTNLLGPVISIAYYILQAQRIITSRFGTAE
jgi:hypothetical protein